MSNTHGALATVFGVCGLCCFGIIFGPIAIIIGLLGLSRDDSKALSTVGIILGICDIIGWAIALLMMGSLFAQFGF